eukprot:CAMPEP_0203689288 /NCGR_PEP_ID=MMETSP0091-20130426/1679_1 /ASSEMBLY_ACC=CAM_ASM_001089 /TAXON_ID=426623 /ORGANISM="Chaetoceros affinis, Strain CCMP159" /LENGTH=40 /DNA_ID= /DNA_START= /DNA_END= /DNA_ORIENTATION=
MTNTNIKIFFFSSSSIMESTATTVKVGMKIHLAENYEHLR